jgi:SAM-dependent methyltransferase
MNPAEFRNIAAAEADFWWYRGMRRIMFRLLDPLAAQRRFDRVAEIGAGTGYFAGELERRYQWRMFPLDLGGEGLVQAQRGGLQRLVQADMSRLPYASGAFDAVISMDVIVHLPRGEEGPAVAELTRVLRPGGVAAIRVAALDMLRSRHSIFAHERQRFTRPRLVALAEQNGLRVMHCTYANALLLPVALLKFRIWEPLTRKPPASGVRPVPRWLDRLLHVPLAAEAVWLGAGFSFPAGQSLILLAEKPYAKS